jgi:hypothetical protein
MDKKLCSLLVDGWKQRRRSFELWNTRGGPIRSLKMYKQKLCVQGCRLLYLDYLALGQIINWHVNNLTPRITHVIGEKLVKFDTQNLTYLKCGFPLGREWYRLIPFYKCQHLSSLCLFNKVVNVHLCVSSKVLTIVPKSLLLK